MVKRMSDDDVMNYVYAKLFGDLDGMESKAMFDEDGEGAEDGLGAPDAEPAAPGGAVEGVEIAIKPMMKAAEEKEEEEEDKLKGIGDMSPLMAQLHGKR